jgi:hypothetical protein
MTDLYNLDKICEKCDHYTECNNDSKDLCAASVVLDHVMEAIEEGLNDAVKYL